MANYVNKFFSVHYGPQFCSLIHALIFSLTAVAYHICAPLKHQQRLRRDSYRDSYKKGIILDGLPLSTALKLCIFMAQEIKFFTHIHVDIHTGMHSLRDILLKSSCICKTTTYESVLPVFRFKDITTAG